MHDKGYIPHSSIKRRVNSGTSTKFWHDTWISNTSLRNQFPRLYRLTTNKDILIRDCWNQGWNFSWSRNINSGTNAIQLATLHNMLSGITLSDSADVWVWCIKPPEFLVKNARKHIDNHYLPDGVWNRVLHWLDLSLPTISNIQDLGQGKHGRLGTGEVNTNLFSNMTLRKHNKSRRHDSMNDTSNPAVVANTSVGAGGVTLGQSRDPNNTSFDVALQSIKSKQDFIDTLLGVSLTTLEDIDAFTFSKNINKRIKHGY
ncbi:hypothetical protein CTI12_AA543490 [Artemisia annua]|uniref:RNA-directed DNA polymerase, eukaryota, Reverse transcriptase zinc-binding domain protein n=1 Tax=Artemisia annua TaxID=35608 RepID=A0A2U1L0N7_ARTAN|nr:hypothetical protein CTI12_AA543490 [Artemisia annua]